MEKSQLDKNFDYVNKNIDKLINLYRNKYVLVVNQKVVGSFDTYEAAAKEGVITYGVKGDFLVHLITEDQPVNLVLNADL